MTYEQLMRLMEDEKHKDMTCGEFARILREAEVAVDAVINGLKR